MLRNKDLCNPIAQDRTMNSEEFTKYTDINRNSKCTAPETVKKIYDSFHQVHNSIPTEKLNRIWSFIAAELTKNPGLAQFTLDYKGEESDFFFPWLMSVFTSPSLALEMAYGAGNDLSGNWVYPVPETDHIYDFVKNDPTFVYNRERQLYVADLVKSIQNGSTVDHPSKVVDLGAGRLAWARWHGYEFRPEVQRIYAYDRDATINAKQFGDAVSYKTCDLTQGLADPDARDADLVILGGVATYIEPETFCYRVIPAVHQLLKKGGTFFFDLQMECPYLLRSMSIFDWPKLHFYGQTVHTINAMESVRKALWDKGFRFSAEYALDTINPIASSAMVIFTKL